ncbi:MAG: hypothetical protein P8X90_00560 [Desulfobacterales bacterium]|jgi:hypothetical protein
MGSTRFLVIICIALLSLYRLGEAGPLPTADPSASFLLASDAGDEGEGGFEEGRPGSEEERPQGFGKREQEQPFGNPSREGGPGQGFGRESGGR